MGTPRKESAGRAILFWILVPVFISSRDRDILYVWMGVFVGVLALVDTVRAIRARRPPPADTNARRQA